MSTVFRVEKNANYTVMANYHLKDRRLSYKAKGLLSEMLSLPPDWDYTLSGLAVISTDGLDSVRTAVRELERYGYLVRFQLRDDLGRMSVNEYVVYESPEQNPYFSVADSAEDNTKQSKNGSVKRITPSLENPTTEHTEAETPSLENPITENPTTETPSLENPITENPITENPSTGKPSTENPTTDTIKKLNTNQLNTNQSYHSIRRADARRTEDRIDEMDNQENDDYSEERDYYRDVIRDNIEYNYFYENRNNPKLQVNMGRIDEIVAVMVDVVCSRKKTIRVNGEDLPQAEVKKRFLELDDTHIDYVITALDRSKSEVRNIRAYLITALYNAPVTMESYYDEWVKRDMMGG